jgi:hypothetical protein
MIGPAEIEDLMLEYADAVAAADEAGCSGARGGAPRAWSWGLGPTQESKAEAKPFVLVERQGRLAVIEVATGRTIYTPPDFLSPQSYSEFDLLLSSLNAEGRLIDAVMAFEREATPAASEPRYLTLSSGTFEAHRSA